MKRARRQSGSLAEGMGLEVREIGLEGRDPWQARVKSTSTRVALPLLEKWALRHTGESDCLVLEASGNAFALAERLRRLKRKVLILDSHQAGKVGQTYCATDRVDAI